MTGADHAAQVDADLDEIIEEGFFLLGSEAAAQEQRGVADDATHLAAVRRHVGLGVVGPEIAVVHPGAVGVADVFLEFGSVAGSDDGGQELALEIARQISLSVLP
jgi:hypothetical protein